MATERPNLQTLDPQEQLERIRFNVDACNGAGESGTYETDALDYLNMEVATLRDIRFLLGIIDNQTDQVEISRGIMFGALMLLLDYGDHHSSCGLFSVSQYCDCGWTQEEKRVMRLVEGSE